MSMQRRLLHLHFGAHKCGSTSIQHSLSGMSGPYWRLLQTHPKGNESVSITTAFHSNASKRLQDHPLTSKVIDGDTVKNEYLLQIDSSTAKNFLLSAESIESLDKIGLQSLNNFFCALDLDVHFVGYLRPLASVLPSIFQQRVKGSWKFGKDIADMSELLRLCCPPYPKFISSLFEMKARESIRLFGFSPRSFPDADVVKDFCNRLHIEVKSNKITRVNASLSLIAIKILWINDLRLKSESARGQDRLKLVRSLVGDFGDKEPIRIDSNIIRDIVKSESPRYKVIDKEIEGEESFSLVDISNTNEDSHCNVKTLSDLCLFTQSEKDHIRDVLKSLGHADTSNNDTELAAQYFNLRAGNPGET